jgi:peptidoglycan/LPS O-acetylase OafA/YrhL
MDYRNEIDELRAFALLAVVFYLFTVRQPDGFIGVDFFCDK